MLIIFKQKVLFQIFLFIFYTNNYTICDPYGILLNFQAIKQLACSKDQYLKEAYNDVLKEDKEVRDINFYLTSKNKDKLIKIITKSCDYEDDFSQVDPLGVIEKTKLTFILDFLLYLYNFFIQSTALNYPYNSYYNIYYINAEEINIITQKKDIPNNKIILDLIRISNFINEENFSYLYFIKKLISINDDKSLYVNKGVQLKDSIHVKEKINNGNFDQDSFFNVLFNLLNNNCIENKYPLLVMHPKLDINSLALLLNILLFKKENKDLNKLEIIFNMYKELHNNEVKSYLDVYFIAKESTYELIQNFLIKCANKIEDKKKDEPFKSIKLEPLKNSYVNQKITKEYILYECLVMLDNFKPASLLLVENNEQLDLTKMFYIYAHENINRLTGKHDFINSTEILEEIIFLLSSIFYKIRSHDEIFNFLFMHEVLPLDQKDLLKEYFYFFLSTIIYSTIKWPNCPTLSQPSYPWINTEAIVLLCKTIFIQEIEKDKIELSIKKSFSENFVFVTFPENIEEFKFRLNPNMKNMLLAILNDYQCELIPNEIINLQKIRNVVIVDLLIKIYEILLDPNMKVLFNDSKKSIRFNENQMKGEEYDFNLYALWFLDDNLVNRISRKKENINNYIIKMIKNIVDIIIDKETFKLRINYEVIPNKACSINGGGYQSYILYLDKILNNITEYFSPNFKVLKKEDVKLIEGKSNKFEYDKIIRIINSCFNIVPIQELR